MIIYGGRIIRDESAHLYPNHPESRKQLAREVFWDERKPLSVRVAAGVRLIRVYFEGSLQRARNWRDPGHPGWIQYASGFDVPWAFPPDVLREMRKRYPLRPCPGLRAGYSIWWSRFVSDRPAKKARQRKSASQPGRLVW